MDTLLALNSEHCSNFTWSSAFGLYRLYLSPSRLDRPGIFHSSAGKSSTQRWNCDRRTSTPTNTAIHYRGLRSSQRTRFHNPRTGFLHSGNVLPTRSVNQRLRLQSAYSYIECHAWKSHPDAHRHGFWVDARQQETWIQTSKSIHRSRHCCNLGFGCIHCSDGLAQQLEIRLLGRWSIYRRHRRCISWCNCHLPDNGWSIRNLPECRYLHNRLFDKLAR